MGAVLVDAGASLAFCEGDPPIFNGYSWWMRYQGTHTAYAVSSTDGYALISAADEGWSEFDPEAATRLGTAYSSRSAGVRRAVWQGFAHLLYP